MIQRLAATMLLCLHAHCSGQIVTDVAHLRSLVDTVNYLPTDTTNLFTVTGVVTTHANLTSAPNVLLHVQDATAAIALFWNGGANNFVPAAGDTIQVTAPLGHANGLLELRATNSNPAHAVLLQSTGDALPEPTPLNFQWKNDVATIEAQESKYVVTSNVFLDLGGAVFTAGSNVNITNAAGEISHFALMTTQTSADNPNRRTSSRSSASCRSWIPRVRAPAAMSWCPHALLIL